MAKVVLEFEWSGDVVPKKWVITCGHDFVGIPVDEMTTVPPNVKVGAPNGIEDRRCTWCGVIHRGWAEVWEDYDNNKSRVTGDNAA